MNCRIVKADATLRTAYGWALLTEVDGEPYFDRQGDNPEPVSVEKAVTRFMYDRATGGVMHKRTPDGEPVRVGRIVESIVVDDNKLQAMGLPVARGRGPRGWWLGIRYDETPEGEAVWKAIREGRLRGFSIAGRGFRKAVVA